LPVINGSPVTAYKLSIQQFDGSFSKQTDYCDAEFNAAIVSSRECTVPISVLTSAPYSLTLGDSVFAKVIAINYYG